MSNIFLDNTRVSAFMTCPRYFYFRHVRHWTPTRTASPLLFGTCWHEAMDVVWQGAAAPSDQISNQQLVEIAGIKFYEKWLEEGGTPMEELNPDFYDIRTPELALRMLGWYVNKYRSTIAQSEVLGVEKPFAVHFGQFGGDDVYLVGRLDKIFRTQRLEVWLADHKTTTSYKKDGPFREQWLNSFSPNNQMSGYLYAGHALYGKEFRGIYIDGVLVHKTIDGGRWIPLLKQHGFLSAWRLNAHYWIQRLISALNQTGEGFEEGAIHRIWPMNSINCHNYRGCDFLDICRFMSPDPSEIEETPDGFMEERWEPFKEAELEAAAKEAIE